MRRLIVPILCLTLLAACGGGDDDDASNGQSSKPVKAEEGRLEVAMASYDLAVGPPGRFMVGVFNREKGHVGYGTAELALSFLGETAASGKPEPGPTATGRYLPLPHSGPLPASTDKPIFQTERGVYTADVAFDRAGYWQVKATVAIDEPQSAETAFIVLPKHEAPMPGEPAIASQNLTMTTPGAPPSAVDSRASETTAVPDPELHQTTVAEALQKGRPILLVISTPTFCQSQFCGPITDMAAELAKEYGDRATFIHIEVWRDFEASQLNPAAAEWIARGKEPREPWVFLIGADGKIAARWDNVATRSEIEPLLGQLPVIAG